MPTAYSYCRFSDVQQEQGTSISRQIAQREKWLKEHSEYTLDTKISLRDLGVSAFRGRNLNPEYGDLGKFIDLVQRDNSPIEKGSVLLLERLDRFSRDKPMLAITALANLIYAGVDVVSTEDGMWLTRETINKLEVAIPVVVNLCIAHEQSREKSYRVGEAWKIRRERLSTEKKLLTRKLPSWLFYDEEKDEIKVHQEKAKAIKYVFKRTNEGIGQVVLCKEMNEKFKPLSTHKLKNNEVRAWNTSFISALLNDRSVVGEFQPKTKDEKGKRVDVGQPIKGYYPAIISEDDFYSAQYQKSLRKKEHADSQTDFVNLFQGLVVDRLDKSLMQIQTSRTKRLDGSVYVQRRLCSYAKRRGLKGSSKSTIDYYMFERVILDALTELNPKDFKEKFDTSKEVRKIYEEIEGAKLKQKELQELLVDINSKQPAANIVDALNKLDGLILEKENRLEALANIDNDSTNTFDEGLKTMVSAAATRENDGDKNLRNKLRAIMPTIIDRISVRLIKLKNKRVVAVANIYLTNGDLRMCNIFNASNVLGQNQTISFIGDNDVAVKITPNGKIIWNPLARKKRPLRITKELQGVEFGGAGCKRSLDVHDFRGQTVFINGKKRKCGKSEMEILAKFTELWLEITGLRVDGAIAKRIP